MVVECRRCPGDRSSGAPVERRVESAMTAAGASPTLAYHLADVLQWDLDFTRDLRVGDSFRIAYESVYVDFTDGGLNDTPRDFVTAVGGLGGRGRFLNGGSGGPISAGGRGGPGVIQIHVSNPWRRPAEFGRPGTRVFVPGSATRHPDPLSLVSTPPAVTLFPFLEVSPESFPASGTTGSSD